MLILWHAPKNEPRKPISAKTEIASLLIGLGAAAPPKNPLLQASMDRWIYGGTAAKEALSPNS